MPRVFISHASANRDFVEAEIIAPLRGRSIQTWYSHDEITTAEEWLKSIRKGLERCDWFLVAVSNAAIGSDWVRAEVSWAIKQRRGHIVPVLIEPCDPSQIHLQLDLIQHVDFCEPSEDARERLLKAFPSDAPPSEEDPPPSSDKDALIAELRRIRAERDAADIVVVFSSLAHPEAAVRTRAQQALHTIGWEAAATAVVAAARSGDPEAVDGILDGLAALESHQKTILVLDGLVECLHGDLRNRAILLLERKQLALGLETIRPLLREHRPSWEIERVLGQGLVAATYLARHRETELKVAIRVLRPELALQPNPRTSFIKVARRSVFYIHQNLAACRDTGEFPDQRIYFCIRDYVDGATLQSALDSGVRFEPTQAIGMMQKVASALEPIHRRNEVHGGIKPSNIFLCTADHLVLGDPSPPMTELGFQMKRLSYDLRYAAPESFAAEKPLTVSADYYSLGCLLYQLLCGEPPFVDDNPFDLVSLHRQAKPVPPSQHCPSLGAETDRILLRWLAKDPSDRPRDLKQVQDDLDRLQHAVESSLAHLPPPAAQLDTPRLRDLEPDYSVVDLTDPGDVYGTILPTSDRISGATPNPFRGPELEPSDEPGSVYELITDPSVQEPTGGSAAPRSFASESVAAGRLIGDCRIVHLLGRGGSGEVYVAEHVRLQKPVAVKILHPFLTHEGGIERFLLEARVASRVEHPNVITIFDVGEQDGLYYIVMQLVDGKNLAELVKEQGGRLPWRSAARLVCLAARGLEAIHRHNFIHRDVKPSNIMLSSDSRVLLMDFGLVREEQDSELTREGSVCGTPAYMSPEQSRGSPLDRRTDIYSLGGTLYYLLTGTPPFSGSPAQVIGALVSGQSPPPIETVNPDVPKELSDLVTQAMAIDPNQRFATAGEMADSLQRLLRNASARDTDLGDLFDPQ